MAKEPITINGEKYSFDESNGKWFAGKKEAPIATAKMLDRVSATVKTAEVQEDVSTAELLKPEPQAQKQESDKPRLPKVSSDNLKESLNHIDANLDKSSDNLKESLNHIDANLDKSSKVLDNLSKVLDNIKDAFIKRKPINERESLGKLMDLTNAEKTRLKKMGIAPMSPNDFSYRKDGIPLSKNDITEHLNNHANDHNKKLGDQHDKVNNHRDKVKRLAGDAAKKYVGHVHERLAVHMPIMDDIAKVMNWFKKDKEPIKREHAFPIMNLDSSKLLMSIDKNVSNILSYMMTGKIKEEEKQEHEQVEKLNEREDKERHDAEQVSEKSKTSVGEKLKKLFTRESKDEESKDEEGEGNKGSFLHDATKVAAGVAEEKVGEHVLSKVGPKVKNLFGNGKSPKGGSLLKDAAPEAAGAEALGGEAGAAVGGAEALGGLVEGGGLLAGIGEGLAGVGAVLAAPEVLAGAAAVAGTAALGYGAYKLFDGGDASPAPTATPTTKRSPMIATPKTHPATKIHAPLQEKSKQLVTMDREHEKRKDAKTSKQFATAGHTIINNKTNNSSAGGSGGGVTISPTAAPRNSLDLNYWSN